MKRKVEERKAERFFDKVTIVSLALALAGTFFLFGIPTFTQAYFAQFNALGSSLLIAALLAFTFDKTTASALLEKQEDFLKDRIAGIEVRESGIVGVSQGLPHNEVIQRMRSSHHFQMVTTWSPELMNILRGGVEDERSRISKVDVFLLHPASALAAQRSRDLGMPENYTQTQIEANISFVRATHRALSAKQKVDGRVNAPEVNLYLFECGVPCAIFKIDELTWINTMWLGQHSDGTTSVVVDDKIRGAISEHIDRQIEEVRARSVRVDLDKSELPPVLIGTLRGLPV